MSRREPPLAKPVIMINSKPSPAVPLERSAATSHRRNDAYMEDFEQAHAALSNKRVGPEARQHATAGGASSSTLKADLGAQTVRGARGGASSTLPDGHSPHVCTHLGAGWWRGPVDPAGKLADLSERPLLAMATDGSRHEVAIAGSDHAVYTLDMASGRKGRTLYGGRSGHSEWVTGVCYVGDGSGRVASSGMDGKVCLWDARSSGKSSMCLDLLGHFGSVALVLAPGGGTLACGPSSGASAHSKILFSAGYDKTVRMWHTDTGACVSVGKAHGAPVLCAALHAGPAGSGMTALTGDRDGVANVWDINAGGLGTAQALRGHKGHVTACAWLAYCGQSIAGSNALHDSVADSAHASCSARPLAITGAQDGHVRVWDTRAPPSASCVADVAAHTSAAGSGAIGDIAVTTAGPLGSSGSTGHASSYPADLVIVTSGADKRIVVTDPRGGWRTRAVMAEHRDFLYSLWAVGPLVLSGGGDGVLLAHDISGVGTGEAGQAPGSFGGRLLWGLGANAAAVRCIGTSGRRMVAAGDDGKAITYDFPAS